MQCLSNVKCFDRKNIFGVKFNKYDLFRPLPTCRALGAIDFLIFPTFVYMLAENHTNNIETIESPKVFVDLKAKMASNVFLRSQGWRKRGMGQWGLPQILADQKT